MVIRFEGRRARFQTSVYNIHDAADVACGSTVTTRSELIEKEEIKRRCFFLSAVLKAPFNFF
jgi:hypothetical protein